VHCDINSVKMAEGLRKPGPLVFDSNIGKCWEEFEEEFNIYRVAALHDKTAKVQAYTLLNLAGPEAIKRSKNFVYEDDESKENPDTLLAKFKNLCAPQANISLERHIFFTRDQKSGESLEAYINDLRSKASTCDFGDLKDSLIRDKFISGVCSENLRRILLKEKDLTLQKTIEIAQLDELTQVRLKAFKVPQPKKEDCHVAVVSVQCPNCGQNHQTGQCPAKNRQCHKCKRYGHYAMKCPPGPPVKANQKPHYSVKKKTATLRPKPVNKTRTVVHEIHADDDDDDAYVIDSLDADGHHSEAFVQLKVNGNLVEMKVDSGAKVNVITQEKLLQLCDAVQIDKTKKVKLCVFGGYTFYSLGLATVQCGFRGKQFPLQFQVVDRPAKCLLSLADAERLGICHMSREVYYSAEDVCVIDLDDEFVDYKDLFQDSLGKLPVRCKLEVDQSVPPVVRSAYHIPVAMKDRVKRELDDMESRGVISKVKEPTEWVSAMVVAKKKNKDEIRICIDPRDLNKALKRPHHHLTTVDDILKEIPEAKVFSVLDAKNGFWNIPLDEESSKLTCFSTAFGRYKFNVLPYGVIVGSEIYQKTMDDLFEEQPCKVIVDDILVWGRDDDDHDRKIKSVLERCKDVNLRLNIKKCKFRVRKVGYVGHLFTDKGVLPDPDKVTAIEGMPTPTDVQSLQRFLGMINYLNKFIEGYSQLTAPLRELLRKDVEFVWMPHHN